MAIYSYDSGELTPIEDMPTARLTQPELLDSVGRARDQRLEIHHSYLKSLYEELNDIERLIDAEAVELSQLSNTYYRAEELLEPKRRYTVQAQQQNSIYLTCQRMGKMRSRHVEILRTIHQHQRAVAMLEQVRR